MGVFWFATIGLVLGFGVAWIVTRRAYLAGKAAGYLDGRNFLTSRRILLRTPVWIDGVAIDDACCVWIETNNFTAEEQVRIDAAEHFRKYQRPAAC